MRIAVFTESYEPIVNGVSVAVSSLRESLTARGHDVYIFAPEFPGHKDDEGVFRFPSRITRLAKGYPIPIPYAPDLRRTFRKLQPDIVHTQTPFILGMEGLKWARYIDVPVVSTNHTLYKDYVHYLPFVPKKLTRAVLEKGMRWYYNKCDAVVVPAAPVAEILKSYGVSKPIEVIKSGVTVADTDNGDDLRARFNIPPDVFLLLYAGRVAREKNIGMLLRAFKAVLEQLPGTRLMIAGEGPYEEALKEKSRDLGIKDYVVFTGVLNHNDIARAYRTADIFVFPSVTDTQGLVVCEALTTGLPCVAVRAAGIPEVIDDGISGILTEKSAEDFSGAIIKLLSNSDLRRQFSEGAIKSSARFTISAMAEKFEKFYQSTIDMKKGKIWNTSCNR